MAPITKKTYSRRNNELHDSRVTEKENVDPFDELFSSPLKQDVKFKPLSFWGKKVKNLECKNKSKTVNFGLYESDSDDPSSPNQRRRKPKARTGISKRSKLQLLATNNGLKERKNPFSAPFVNLRKHYKFFLSANKLDASFSNISRQKLHFSETNPDGSHEGIYNILPLIKPKQSKIQSEDEGKRISGNWQGGREEMGECDTDIMDSLFECARVESEKGRMSVLYTNDRMEETKCINNSSKGNHTILCPNENMDETWCIENSVILGKEASLMEFQTENTLRNSFSSSLLDDTEFESLVEELLEMQNGTTVFDKTEILDKTSDDDTIGNFTSDESTTIHNSLGWKTNDSPAEGSDFTQCENVSLLTTKISDMMISNGNLTATTSGKASPGVSEVNVEDSGKMPEEAFRNVTTRRRYHQAYSKKAVTPRRDSQMEKESHLDEEDESDPEKDSDFEYPSLILKDGTHMDWNRLSCFENPVFESTRVFDDVRCRRISIGEKGKSLLERSQHPDTSMNLKPGKKWFRSMSVLKRLRNGNAAQDRLESTRIKGRSYESFVQDMLEMQNDVSGFSTILDDTAATEEVNSTVLERSLFNSASQLKESGEEDSHDCSSLDCSSLSKSVSKGFDRTLMNHTVKVCQFENSGEKPSAFRSALGLEGKDHLVEEIIIGEGEYTGVSAREFVLSQCGQKDALPFEEYFNEKRLKDCKKIGEGVYGEVFMYNSDTVIKILPIEGSALVNGEPQKTFEEVISEIVIALKLSNLRTGKNFRTSGFSETRRCWCVKGKYPKHLIKLWNEYDKIGAGSDNESPVMFGPHQLYIVLELAHGGRDLESFVFSSSAQSLSIFVQAAFSLAAAENAFQFEHRDLHWGNLLVAPTKDKFATFLLNDVEYNVPTKGVKVTIIDFTLSRMFHDGCCIFNDLSVDPGLFVSQGDYQFDIYRMMQKEVGNDWSLFRPRTNLYWLHYTIDKMLKLVRYKNKKTQVHRKFMREMKILGSDILDHRNSTEFVLGSAMRELLEGF